LVAPLAIKSRLPEKCGDKRFQLGASRGVFREGHPARLMRLTRALRLGFMAAGEVPAMVRKEL
jgi:hypothetical protein